MIKYSKHYSKLNDEIHTTIRRYKKGKKVRDHQDEFINGKYIQTVRISLIKRKTLNQITDKLLLKDTDCKTRAEAINLLQSFYKKPIDPENEKLFIFYLTVI